VNVLIRAAYELLAKEPIQHTAEDEHRFIELITFSNSKEILEMLDKVLNDDWIGFPIWARNLSFRLACLLDPANPLLLRRAAADLRCFGPDWDEEANILEKKADDLEFGARSRD